MDYCAHRQTFIIKIIRRLEGKTFTELEAMDVFSLKM